MRCFNLVGRFLLVVLLIGVLSTFVCGDACTVQAAGAQTLGELAPGSIVVDRTAEWTFRIGENYNGDSFKRAPVEWVVVAQNHFASGATLLISREMVARHMFNFDEGDNVWFRSNLYNWLRVVFYHHLSEEFRDGIVPVTTITGGSQLDNETIFILSDTELGSVRDGSDGTRINYFNSTTRKPRANVLNELVMGYWTRSGDWAFGHHRVYIVWLDNGTFVPTPYTNNGADIGVRPAVNLASDTRVNEEGGVYVINWAPDRIFLPHHPIRINPDLLPLTPQVTEITVTGAGGATEVAVGETLQMHAAVSPDNAPEEVTWSVTAGTGNASIDAGGLLTGVSPGTVIVVASASDDSGVTGSCEITIVEPGPGDPGEERDAGDNGEPADPPGIEGGLPRAELPWNITITMTDDNPDRIYSPADRMAFEIDGLDQQAEIKVAFGIFTGRQSYQEEAVIEGLVLFDVYYTRAVPVNGGLAALEGTVREGLPAGAVAVRLEIDGSWTEPVALTWNDGGREKYVLVGVGDYAEFEAILSDRQTDKGGMEGLLDRVSAVIEQNPLLFLGIVLGVVLFLVLVITLVARSSRRRKGPAPSGPAPSNPAPSNGEKAARSEVDSNKAEPAAEPGPDSSTES